MFEQTLEMYRKNFIEYKLTGNSAYRTSAESARAWLERYVQGLQTQSTNQNNELKNFVSQYQTANPELVEIQRRIRNVQKEGPRLQDVYETEREAQEEEPIDYSQYYVKVGLITGVLGIIAVLAFV